MYKRQPQNNAPEPEKLSISTKLSDAAEEKDMSFGLIEFTAVSYTHLAGKQSVYALFRFLSSV